MNWRPWDELEREAKIIHAARRGLIRLRSGRIAILVRYGKPACNVRCEAHNGSRFTVPVREVEAWAEPLTNRASRVAGGA